MNKDIKKCSQEKRQSSVKLLPSLKLRRDRTAWQAEGPERYLFFIYREIPIEENALDLRRNINAEPHLLSRHLGPQEMDHAQRQIAFYYARHDLRAGPNEPFCYLKYTLEFQIGAGNTVMGRGPRALERCRKSNMEKVSDGLSKR